MRLKTKLQSYYFTAILSLLFAVLGFSYNAWRMELSEDNNNIRTASFEVLKELAELEQIIFAAHYDQNAVAGNPRTGWVKVGLITDLSVLVSRGAETQSMELKSIWSKNWSSMSKDREAVDELIRAIDVVRAEIKSVLSELK